MTEPPDNFDFDAAYDELENLVKQAEIDPGAPFEREAVDFLAALRNRNKAEYERARARLKKAQVRVGELDQVVGVQNQRSKGRRLESD